MRLTMGKVSMIKYTFILFISTTLNAQLFEQELLFPPEKWHNHSSSIVELPNGDLLVAWYHGSGEGQADDVFLGLLQPAFAQKKDGTIVCFLRDNGLPKQIRVTESKDNGITWLPA
jgi:predicted neuraminidase